MIKKTDLSVFFDFYREIKMLRVLLKPFLNQLFVICCLSLSFIQVTRADTLLHYEKALSAFKEQRFDASMIHLKNALQSSPDNLPSKILMGELLTQLEQYPAAEVEFEEAIMQGADISLFAKSWGVTLLKRQAYAKIIEFKQFNGFSTIQLLDWQRLRATACMQSKNYECAKESFSQISSSSTDQTEALNGLANIEFNLKNYAAANEYLQQALNINTENATTWQLLGLVARNNNDMKEALKYLQKAFELSPDDPYILRNLADVYLAANNKEAASQTINTILLRSPNDPFAILVNSWLQQDTALSAEAEKKFNELAVKIKVYPTELVEQDQSLLFLRALVAFRQQNFEQAMRDFTKLRKLDDSDISPIILLAKSYIALNKEKDAIELLELQQARLNTLPDILVMLGDLYINNNKNFKALSLLQSLQVEYPDNIQVLLLEAKLMIARERQGAAGFEKLDKLVTQYPENETVLFAHSVLSLQMQQYAKANESISKLVILQPKDAIKLNLKGAVLIKLNQIEEAQQYLKQALIINPDLMAAKINLASSYFLLQQRPQARNILSAILQQQPRNDSALLLLAKIQVYEQQYEDALANYRLVLIDDKQNIEALEGLSSLYIAKNESKDALFQLTKLNKIQPENPKYIIQKAQLYLSMQDKERSKIEIDMLARLAQDDAALMIALSKLQLLAGELNMAIESLERAQALQPKSIRIGIELAELLLNNNLIDKAATQIKQLANKFNHTADLYFLQGRLAEQQGKLQQANTYYLKTLELDDQYELALAKLYTLIANGIPAQAFKAKIDQIVTKYPERYFPRNLLAQYYYYTKDFKQAAFHYEYLLQHEDLPSRSGMLNRLALVYMPSDQLKSVEYAKQAFALNDTNPQILATYGWLLTQQNQAQEGLSLLRKSLARNQQNPSLHYYIAVSLEKLGLVREAISELETLFAKQIEFEEIEQAKLLYQKLTQV